MLNTRSILPLIFALLTSALWVLQTPAAFGQDVMSKVKFQPKGHTQTNNWSDVSSQPENAQKNNKTPFDRPHIDAELERVYKHIANGQLDQAINYVNNLIEQYPNFRVAYLIRGDLYTLKAGIPINHIGDIKNAPVNKMGSLTDLREEAFVRLRAYRIRPSQQQIPRELVQLRSDQRYAILVDTLRSRLFIYENKLPAPRLITDFYISQGKAGANKTREGDNKTPLGVYTITDLLPQKKLTDFYGKLALPLDYPNEWDKRQGKTGHGIWLHGVPSNQISRPPKSSEGCVVLANSDIQKLQRFIKIGNTPVIITENIQFISRQQWQTERSDLLKQLTQVRHDILKDNSGNQTTQGISIFRYPSKEDMLVVNIADHSTHTHRNNKAAARKQRQQYWVRNGRDWKLIHETLSS